LIVLNLKQKKEDKMANPKPKEIITAFLVPDTLRVFVATANSYGAAISFNRIKWEIDEDKRMAVLKLHRKPKKKEEERRATISGPKSEIDRLLFDIESSINV
jgi:hypothetical protein